MADSCTSRDLLAGRYAAVLWHLPLAALVITTFLGPGARALAWPPAFAVMGAACVYNAAHCGRLHCYITGPAFLIAAALSALRGLDVMDFAWSWIGFGTLIATALAYVPEFVCGKYFERRA